MFVLCYPLIFLLLFPPIFSPSQKGCTDYLSPCSFETEETSWGPMVISINGIHASTNEKTYWQFFSSKTSLQQGTSYWFRKRKISELEETHNGCQQSVHKKACVPDTVTITSVIHTYVRTVLDISELFLQQSYAYIIHIYYMWHGCHAGQDHDATTLSGRAGPKCRSKEGTERRWKAVESERSAQIWNHRRTGKKYCQRRRIEPSIKVRYESWKPGVKIQYSRNTEKQRKIYIINFWSWKTVEIG